MIIQFSDLQKIKEYKESVVKGKLIQFWKDKAISDGVDIPFFLYAERDFKEHIHSMKELNYYYKLAIKG